MTLAAAWLAASLAAFPAAAAKKKIDDAAATQEITIKGKGPAGPPVRLPPVAPDGAAADEVTATLDVLKVEHKATPPQLRVPGGPVRRLSRPFPEPPYLSFNPESYRQPHERWTFEVLSGENVVWRAGGRGEAAEKIEWDGTDATGRVAVRVGQPYHFRFTGVRGGEELGVTSEAIELSSVLYRESLGDVHMEVGSALLFASGQAKLLESAAPFLRELAQRLRRVNPELRPLKLTLYQKKPEDKLAKRRAKALKEHFVKSLLVHVSRLEVDAAQAEERGEVLACVLPPDGGAVIRDR